MNHRLVSHPAVVRYALLVGFVALCSQNVAAQTIIYDVTGASVDQFGATVRTVGSINGEPGESIAIGSPRANSNLGRVDVLSFTGGSVQVVGAFDNNTGAGSVLDYGRSFALAPVSTFANGLIGMPRFGGPQTDNAGRVYGVGGINGPGGTGLLGEGQDQELLGWAMEDCDLDGDGIREFLVSAPVTFQGQSAVQGYLLVYDILGIQIAQIDAPSGALRFGESLAALGDVDGDGMDELVPREWNGRRTAP